MGDNRYEISNHLGNVLSVVSDRKIVNRRIRSILIANFDSEDTIERGSIGQSKKFVNKDRELEIYVKDSVSNSGATKIVKLDASETVMFNTDAAQMSLTSQSQH